jgi:hypothetical protein
MASIEMVAKNGSFPAIPIESDLQMRMPSAVIDPNRHGTPSEDPP